jgi:hypothetical protein
LSHDRLIQILMSLAILLFVSVAVLPLSHSVPIPPREDVE